MSLLLRSKELICIMFGLCICQIINNADIVVSGQGRRQQNRASRPYNTFQQRSAIDIKDKIIELQCHAKCEEGYMPPSQVLSPDSHQICYKQCKQETIRQQRRGQCPNVQFKHYISETDKLSCLNHCSYDSDCPEVQKCCESSCGYSVCTDVPEVREDNVLPPIPKILDCKPKGHKVQITIQSSANSTYYCHVEVRYHIGQSLADRKFGKWQWQLVEKLAEISYTRSKRIDVAFDLKPSWWYQVRVAAVNAYGFRGYSEPSKPFALTNKPKPPKAPADVKVVAARLEKNYYTARVIWCPSKSNLPVEKYKVMWSLYIKSNTSGQSQSLISSEADVKDALHYELTNLLPESSYYIQVQAMSISGKRRLKSEKFSFLYNTTIAAHNGHNSLKCGHNQQPFRQKYLNNSNANELPYNNSMQRAKFMDNGVQSSYEVRYRLNRKLGMIVQISGFHSHKEKIYELCSKDTNCDQREYNAIRAKNSLEFSKLKYNTTYVLKILSVVDDIDKKNFSFTTPKCENFRKRFPKVQLKC
ncbi:anosmin-1 isoform X2 [Teleopsis dalmanni]|uniref:anosmin-1 isoform X2 n=1 Tax=Teleopsis dalmanni TaxID=139649 RepID=UPI0018CF700B|nr:anosmin-1 isoform X2 [Teleopsis dalmanni]